MEEIAPGVYQVSVPSNAFLIDGDEGVTLVDTGIPRRHETLTDALRRIGRAPDDLNAILLTHAHVDHFGGASALKQASGADVYTSAADAPAIRGDEEPPPPPFLPPWLAFVTKLLPSADPVSIEHEVGEGSRVPGDISVIETPGHTPGHVCYLLEREGGILFAGDAAVAKGGEVGRGFFNRRGPEWDSSIRHLAEQNFEMASFGHSAAIRREAAGAFQRFAAGL